MIAQVVPGVLRAGASPGEPEITLPDELAVVAPDVEVALPDDRTLPNRNTESGRCIGQVAGAETGTFGRGW